MTNEEFYEKLINQIDKIICLIETQSSISKEERDKIEQKEFAIRVKMIEEKEKQLGLTSITTI